MSSESSFDDDHVDSSSESVKKNSICGEIVEGKMNLFFEELYQLLIFLEQIHHLLLLEHTGQLQPSTPLK